LLYAGGALATGVAFRRVGPPALVLPMVAIVIVVVGARRPARAGQPMP
jgi:hypothetical protein